MVKLVQISSRIGNYLNNNYPLLFQIFIVIYIIQYSYLNFSFTISRNIIKDIEKLIIFNFFQLELACIYFICRAIKQKGNGKINNLKKIYINYIADMKKQQVSKQKADWLLFISLLIFFSIIGLLIYYNPCMI